MQTIKLCSHVGDDGILHLDIPVDITDKQIELVLIYQPIEPVAQTKTPEELGWPSGFFEQTYGICEDDPIIIDSEGNFEVREEIR